MRLFHVQELSIDNNLITITEERVLKHAKVLRLKEGDTIAVQTEKDWSTTRRNWSIESLDKKQLVVKAEDKQTIAHTQEWPGMLVWMPNSLDKLQLIVKKLTELGIQDIVFRKNDRSQGQDISVKKMSKLCKISQEAVEQSNGWKLSTISQVDNIHERVVWKELVLFDFEWEQASSLAWIPKDRLYGVVWPEGHFSPRDYETIGFQVVKKITLGESILRTETAAIVGGRLIKNS